MSYQFGTQAAAATDPYTSGGGWVSCPDVPCPRVRFVPIGPIGRCNTPSLESCQSFLVNTFKWTAVFITPIVPIFFASGMDTIAKDQKCHLNRAVTVAYAVCTLFAVLQCAYAFKNCCCPKDADNRRWASMRSAYPIAAVTGVLIVGIGLSCYATSCISAHQATSNS
ncbi:MAG: hypothetical protein JSS30_05260 [Verrucomicrobia bacterium]|nr:hypothetical protein [Verrucomicrobiota bacterium]